MQMSVYYKPSVSIPLFPLLPFLRHNLGYNPFAVSIRRSREDGRRISGLNYQTGYPQRKLSETVPSSPETRSKRES